MNASQHSKILYVANARMPTEKAHGIQIVKMCEAFAAAGRDVELVIPRRLNRIEANVFSYYDVQKVFSIRKIFCFDLIEMMGKIGFWIQSVSFAFFSTIHILRKPTESVIYTRDIITALFLHENRPIIYEVHRLPKKANWFFRYLIKKVGKFVVITEGLKQDLCAMGIAEKDIFLAPDGVDFHMFAIVKRSQTWREELDLPLHRPLVLYAGHLYPWKGVYTLLDAAVLMPDTSFVFVGGTTADKKTFERTLQEKKLTNVRLIGHTAHRNIPQYLAAADVLVLPNSAKEAISARYTSPLKLFEYMAARRPIVVSNLPSLREILDESTATFFQPDDPKSLVEAINLVFSHADESAQKAARANEKVLQFTWYERANKILNFINA